MHLSYAQVRDSPLTSSAFVRVCKELKNKDEYGQVLFSGFCRKVQYSRLERMRRRRGRRCRSVSLAEGMFVSLALFDTFCFSLCSLLS